MEVECMCSSTHKQRGVLMMTVWRCKKNYNNSQDKWLVWKLLLHNKQMFLILCFFLALQAFMITFWARSTWDPPPAWYCNTKGDSS